MVCLQVHCITGLPSALNGRELIVGWRTGRSKGDQTQLVSVREGMAIFDEIFLHHNARLGGKTMRFNLRGLADGGALCVSMYYRFVKGEDRESQHQRNDSLSDEQCENKCLSCFPEWKNPKRSPPPGAPSLGAPPSLKSNSGFITIENFMQDQLVESEDEDFITLERGTSTTTSVRSNRPHTLNNPKSSEEEALSGFMSEQDGFDVEDEFLRILEEKPWVKVIEQKLRLDMNLELNFDMDSLVMAAEMDFLGGVTQAWRSRLEAIHEEKEVHEELVRGSNGSASESLSSPRTSIEFKAFGSPI
ncbi:hypothetical protein QJS04_geneDACA002226 [Acorus gramineus]|uniref:C2 NT-type domain-containing protein n=1 Tax=Acorus gramineus TaxID=55184 RepID=A0AAV9A9Z8_ACOGR|nr:hypothetical protein QJS04_geneDACA002226 [Acorus gramineus]